MERIIKQSKIPALVNSYCSEVKTENKFKKKRNYRAYSRVKNILKKEKQGRGREPVLRVRVGLRQ